MNLRSSLLCSEAQFAHQTVDVARRILAALSTYSPLRHPCWFLRRTFYCEHFQNHRRIRRTGQRVPMDPPPRLPRSRLVRFPSSPWFSLNSEFYISYFMPEYFNMVSRKARILPLIALKPSPCLLNQWFLRMFVHPRAAQNSVSGPFPRRSVLLWSALRYPGLPLVPLNQRSALPSGNNNCSRWCCWTVLLCQAPSEAFRSWGLSSLPASLKSGFNYHPHL